MKTRFTLTYIYINGIPVHCIAFHSIPFRAIPFHYVLLYSHSVLLYSLTARNSACFFLSVFWCQWFCMKPSTMPSVVWHFRYFTVSKQLRHSPVWAMSWFFLFYFIFFFFFVFCKLHLQMCIRSHPMGLDVWDLVGLFVYFHTSCVRTAKALARLRGCTGSPEPSLVAYVISTIISWAGLFIHYLFTINHVLFTYVWITTSSYVIQILPLSPNTWNSELCYMLWELKVVIPMWNIECVLKLQEYMSRLMTKPTKWHVRPAKTQISLGIRPVWPKSSLCALIRVFAVRFDQSLRSVLNG